MVVFRQSEIVSFRQMALFADSQNGTSARPIKRQSLPFDFGGRTPEAEQLQQRKKVPLLIAKDQNEIISL